MPLDLQQVHPGMVPRQWWKYRRVSRNTQRRLSPVLWTGTETLRPYSIGQSKSYVQEVGKYLHLFGDRNCKVTWKRVCIPRGWRFGSIMPICHTKRKINLNYFPLSNLTNSGLRLNIYDTVSLLPEKRTAQWPDFCKMWISVCSLASLAGPRSEREAEKWGHF